MKLADSSPKPRHFGHTELTVRACLAHCFLAQAALAAGEPVERMISTDGNLYLEYATPHGNVLPWSTREDLVSDLRRYHDANAVAAMIGP